MLGTKMETLLAVVEYKNFTKVKFFILLIIEFNN